jgi:hypothetical protein
VIDRALAFLQASFSHIQGNSPTNKKILFLYALFFLYALLNILLQKKNNCSRKILSKICNLIRSIAVLTVPFYRSFTIFIAGNWIYGSWP